jgi:hypothetical protein
MMVRFLNLNASTASLDGTQMKESAMANVVIIMNDVLNATQKDVLAAQTDIWSPKKDHVCLILLTVQFKPLISQKASM